MQDSTFFSNRLIATKRQLMVRLLSNRLPLYIVNEYPKCGGSWIGEMLARALQIPFPRNKMPELQPSVMHGHYVNGRGMSNILMVWRDPRDVMVSLYYQSYFSHDHGNDRLVDLCKRRRPFRDYDNIRENLPTFILNSYQKPFRPRVSYSAFIRYWHCRKDVTYTSYEAFRASPEIELTRVVDALSGVKLSQENASAIVDEFSFIRQSGRSAGEQDSKSFIRKGIVGDWKNAFSEKAKTAMSKVAGEDLVRLGYEADSDWALPKA